MITTQAHTRHQKANQPVATLSKPTGVPSNTVLNQLIQYFNQGMQAEALSLALTLTQDYPKHGIAWKVLGVLYQQSMQLEAAEQALKNAAELLSKDPEAQYNYANCLYDAGKLQAAQVSYQKAVKLAPQFVQALFNLADVQKELKQWALAEANYRKAFKLAPQHVHMHFNFGVVLQEQGKHKEAVKQYEKALSVDADNASIHLNLGAAYKALDEFDAAEQHYRTAIRCNPSHAGAHNNLGIVLKALQRDDEAEQAYLQAIAIDEQFLPAYKNLGLLYKETGQVQAAENCYLKALSLEPATAETLNNMGVVMMNQGRYPDAEEAVRKALALAPNLGDAWNNLGLILQAKMVSLEAEQAFEQALKFQPNDARTLSNYSVTLKALGKLSQAEACLKKAISKDPNYADAYLNLGNVYLDQGMITQAITSIQRVLDIAPDHKCAHDNLLFAMTYSDDYTSAARLEVAHQYGQLTKSLAHTPYAQWQVDAQDQRLRVGLVSGDLRQHPVAYFLKAWLAQVDPNKIALFAYSTDGREDATTATLKPYFAHWQSLAGHNDQAAAALIHADQLHVLLDLSGHTSANKLPLFAWQPAPVQASWLGYWATTGVEAMDYVLVDPMGVPVEHQTQFTETIEYLPDTRMCFTAPEQAPEVAALPALHNGYITFGCFQNMTKVSDAVLKVWAEVMHALPNAQLRWQSKSFADAQMVDAVKTRLQQCGIAPARVTLLGKVTREEYLASYAEVDMVLDSFPFTGGTTTCEALWMGVPTLTLAGDTLIARQGASMMHAAGLADWVVHTPAQYVQQALHFANGIEHLAKLRAGLRAQVQASALMDAQRFAKQMETALRSMWEAKAPVLAKAGKLQPASNTYLQAKKQVLTSTQSMTVEVISATRMTEQAFWQDSALGQSLTAHMAKDSRIAARVAYENSRGLPEIFNTCIAKADDDAVLVFVHDDVWLDQPNLVDTVLAGLHQFDVIGVAGNRRRLPKQPAWAFINTQFTWDDKQYLSGKVGHGRYANGEVSDYGVVPAACELMDGVFLAAKKATLTQHQVTFDTQFDFHFYDLDFCRTARNAGVTLGTWPIQLTHQSGGAFGSASWQTHYQRYLAKWETATEAPANISADLKLAVQAVLDHAQAQLDAGNQEGAMTLYQEVVAIDPQHAVANHALGVLAANQGALHTAIDKLEQSVTAQPQEEQYWVSYIDALMLTDALDTAMSAIQHGQQYGLSTAMAETLIQECSQKQAQAAHHAPTVETAPITLHRPQKQTVAGDDFPAAWLRAYPTSLMIEYTSRCNLRCKYCPKSNPGEDTVPGRNMDMTHDTVDAVIALIQQHPYRELLLAGTGESTFHPNWLEDFPRLIQAGKAANPTAYIHLNSNFATKYEDEHWAVLAQLDGIVISIDTADRQLTKEVRAKSDLGLIIYNIVRFQTYCEVRGLRLPNITVNVTLYERAAEGLVELMVMLSKLPVTAVAISDLYEGKAATQNGVRAINADNIEAFHAAVKALEQAAEVANSLAKFNFTIQPHLIERIAQIKASINGTALSNPTLQIEQGQALTKLCLQPWTRFTLAADAAIFPCCVTDMDAVGRIDTKREEDGLDGEKIQLFRKRLLSGDVPEICVSCTNAPTCSTQQLQQSVQHLAESQRPMPAHKAEPTTQVQTVDEAIADVMALAEEELANEHYSDVIALCQQVLQVSPQHALANHTIGFCQARQDMNRVEIAYFEQAVNSAPDNAQFWVSFIDTLIHQGKLARAKSAIQLGAEYALDSTLATELLAEVEQLMLHTDETSVEKEIETLCSETSIQQMMQQTIHLNESEVQVHLARLHAGEASTISPNLDLRLFQHTLELLTQTQRKNAALALMHQVILHIKLTPAFVGHKIFTPCFDQVLADLDLGIDHIVPRHQKSANVIIATELYDFGGHTRVISEIIANVENPILIVSDIFQRFEKLNMLAKVANQLSNCPVIVLPNMSYLEKATEIATYINQHAKNVFLLAHHDDSVAIAACQKNIDAHYYFIHHADHHPALGNHVPHFQHVDLFSARATHCHEDLHVPTHFLPTTAKDQGVKVFEDTITHFSTVTAGSFGKFATTGALSLAAIAITALKTGGGEHYHFGDIPAEYLAQIQQDIQAAGLDARRFQYRGNVPSLWQSLTQINAHIYIGSAPLMGAKSDIEAQGAGYPLLAYRDHHSPRHLNVGGHHPETVYWADLEGLSNGMRTIMANHAKYAQASRQFYLSDCAVEKRNAALQWMSQ